jgi:hypothetical protein
MMFDGGTDDVITFPYQPGYSEIVSLSAAAREYNFGRTATEQSRNRFTSSLDRRTSLLAMVMDGGRVPEMFAKIWPHRLQDFRQHGSRGVVVEIDPPHISIVFPPHKAEQRKPIVASVQQLWR